MGNTDGGGKKGEKDIGSIQETREEAGVDNTEIKRNGCVNTK